MERISQGIKSSKEVKQRDEGEGRTKTRFLNEINKKIERIYGEMDEIRAISIPACQN